MRGLIVKDLMILKNQLKSLLVILCFFVVFAITTKDFSFISYIIPFYIVMLLISTFSYDEFNHWDTFCNTLPYTKKEIVKSKYVLLLISLAAALGFGLVISLITNPSDIISSMSFTVGSIFGVTLILALLMPCLYKFGVQKGRIMLLSVLIGISLITTLIFNTVKFDTTKILAFLNNISLTWVIVGMSVLMLIIIYISYKVSSHIYMKKEF